MRGMYSFIIIALILLMVSGVIAISENSKIESIEEKLKERGKIPTITTKVDFSNPPEEINIQNIIDTRLKFYKTDLTEGKSVFIVTASNELSKAQQTQTSMQRAFLHFGFNRQMNESTFLHTPTGINQNKELGYVMISRGSITGISTILESLQGTGNIEIIIYKNGEEVGFRNTLYINSQGIKKDFDAQSADIVRFSEGDIISVYLNNQNNTQIQNVITLLEISFE